MDELDILIMKNAVYAQHYEELYEVFDQQMLKMHIFYNNRKKELPEHSKFLYKVLCERHEYFNGFYLYFEELKFMNFDDEEFAVRKLYDGWQSLFQSIYSAFITLEFFCEEYIP